MSRQLYLTPGHATRQLTPAELMREAVAQLDGGGGGDAPPKWIKGEFHDDQGGSCALGAIEQALSGNSIYIPLYDAAMLRLLTTLKEMHPELTATNIADLNDDPNVTYEDIIAAFEKTALHFEEHQ